MPAFDTPEAISVTLEIGAGDVRITAEDRTDTVVEVRPTDESDSSDVKAAAQSSVKYADGRLVVKTPKPGAMDFSRKSRSVDVTIVLPAGSHVRGDASMGDLRTTGRLGECTFKTAAGHIQVDRVGPSRLRTSAGNVTVGQAEGDLDVSTGTGRIRVGEVHGTATTKNSNGVTEIGRSLGDVRVHNANGDISVGHASGLRTDADTANGSIRIGEVTRGAVVLKTATGDLEIGIGAGQPAKLDLTTGFGRVHNMLENAGDAAETSLDKSLEKPAGAAIDVRGKTSYGDITIHRG
ncbi:DUF4097 and DUF4098 domain-containing protein YvlB [Actinacidiphila yanglinensis]|uniref:DUF4097 and DUF4098 domain-containing protein YvlB n=1 Tax=Actinacidiphila yanglinensis TaxID=310779 RepID=A0A1H5SRW5_9ACTN|nr:DUF4097 family beta strand repeat-containing protein [Actinacidiphila yanglinensis]SEF53289.1 DUF4097 and DUF4098 domain-containing protein YvlB [Actinacidiphila yanglinensis]